MDVEEKEKEKGEEGELHPHFADRCLTEGWMYHVSFGKSDAADQRRMSVSTPLSLGKNA